MEMERFVHERKFIDYYLILSLVILEDLSLFMLEERKKTFVLPLGQIEEEKKNRRPLTLKKQSRKILLLSLEITIISQEPRREIVHRTLLRRHFRLIHKIKALIL